MPRVDRLRYLAYPVTGSKGGILVINPDIFADPSKDFAIIPVSHIKDPDPINWLSLMNLKRGVCTKCRVRPEILPQTRECLIDLPGGEFSNFALFCPRDQRYFSDAPDAIGCRDSCIWAVSRI